MFSLTCVGEHSLVAVLNLAFKSIAYSVVAIQRTGSQPLFVPRVKCLLCSPVDYLTPRFCLYCIFRGQLFLADIISRFTQSTERDIPTLIYTRFYVQSSSAFGMLDYIIRFSKYQIPLTAGLLTMLLTPQQNPFNGNNFTTIWSLWQQASHTNKIS